MAITVLAQQPVQLSEKCLQNLLLNLPPHAVYPKIHNQFDELEVVSCAKCM